MGAGVKVFWAVPLGGGGFEFCWLLLAAVPGFSFFLALLAGCFLQPRKLAGWASPQLAHLNMGSSLFF